MLGSNNFSVHHTLKEGNQSADFLAMMGSVSDVGFVIHSAPPEDLLHLIQSDASGVFFPRTKFSLFSFFFVLFSFVFD